MKTNQSCTFILLQQKLYVKTIVFEVIILNYNDIYYTHYKL